MAPSAQGRISFIVSGEGGLVTKVPDNGFRTGLSELKALLSPVGDEAAANAPEGLTRFVTCSCSMASPCPKRSELRAAWRSFRACREPSFAEGGGRTVARYSSGFGTR